MHYVSAWIRFPSTFPKKYLNHESTLLYECSKTAVTKYHNAGGLNTRTAFCHSSRSYMSMKVCTGLLFLRCLTLVNGCLLPVFSYHIPSMCVVSQFLLFIRTLSNWMRTHSNDLFHLNYLSKDPTWVPSEVVGFRTSMYEFWRDIIQPLTTRYMKTLINWNRRTITQTWKRRENELYGQGLQ